MPVVLYLCAVDAAMTSPSPSPSSVSVVVETAGGHWRLFREPSPTGQIVAFYQQQSDGRPRGHIRGSIWQVEEELGFALPLDVHLALRDDRAAASLDWLAPGEFPLVSGGVLPDEPSQTVPRRHHRVYTPQNGPRTYGRLQHAAPPVRSWENDRYRLEILGSALTREPGLQLTLGAYRVWVDGRIILAGQDLDLTTIDPTSDTALRRLAQQCLSWERAARGYTARQTAFLQDDLAGLQAALAVPAAPYPPGTRIQARGSADATAALGTVVTTARDSTGTLHYVWRPDVYDLPGHPFQEHHIDHTLASPEHLVEPTLHGPDTAIDGPDAPIVLTYGGRIRTIDHPHVDQGTVTRALIGRDDLIYEIRPDGQTGTVRLPAQDVEPIAGTAWPTVESILDARAAAGLPLADDEILVALRELTTTTRGPLGPAVNTPGRPLHSLDVTLDPDSPDLPAPTFDWFRRDTATRPAFLTVNGDTVRIIDATHGSIDVHTTTLTAALRRSDTDLTTLLAQHSTVELDGAESHLTKAALAAAHVPDITTAPTADGPGPPPPAAGEPDPPFELDL